MFLLRLKNCVIERKSDNDNAQEIRYRTSPEPESPFPAKSILQIWSKRFTLRTVRYNLTTLLHVPNHNGLTKKVYFILPYRYIFKKRKTNPLDEKHRLFPGRASSTVWGAIDILLVEKTWKNEKEQKRWRRVKFICKKRAVQLRDDEDSCYHSARFSGKK